MTRYTLDTIKAALLIAAAGVAVYASGLSGQFLGDDGSQIVNNVPVHSLGNLGQFFSHSTFYDGRWLQSGYYRPLMTTTFSALYTVFGANPFWFHLLQLLLAILCAFVLFLVLRYFLRPATSLVLALIFLVYPIDSQNVFAIASMQEPLFMFFGLLGLWTLLRFYYQSAWWLLLTAALLLLSLLSKETGILFAVMVLVYTFMHDKDRRKRVYPLLGLSLAALAVYLPLRLHAVGLAVNPNLAPIDSLKLTGRLMNIPAIVAFYLARFAWPFSLAHAYYWAYPNFTIQYFLWPLVVDLVAVALVVYLAWLVRRRATKDRYGQLFVFFSLWLLVGLLMTLPWVPLDMTVCETWFIFPMVGALGMIGVLVEVFPLRLPYRWLMAAVIVLLAVIGVRTAVRGLDWSSHVALSYHDVAVSKEDYGSEQAIASYLTQNGDYAGAEAHEQRSLAIYPNAIEYELLGVIAANLGEYPQAKQAFTASLRYHGVGSDVYDELAQLDVMYGNPQESEQSIRGFITKLPTDSGLWFDLAILEDEHGDNADARAAITHAVALGETNPAAYADIMSDTKFMLTFSFK